MDVNEFTIDVKQLFLLCVLREGKTVKARNILGYDWTLQHQQSFERKLRDHKSEQDTSIAKIKEEVNTEFSKQESKIREFYLYRTASGFDLCDKDEGLTWYRPGLSSEWAYKGNFILTEPISFSEQYTLKHYFGV